jgi:hypothetical protein
MGAGLPAGCVGTAFEAVVTEVASHEARSDRTHLGDADHGRSVSGSILIEGRGEGGVRGSLRWQPNATKHPALGIAPTSGKLRRRRRPV